MKKSILLCIFLLVIVARSSDNIASEKRLNVVTTLPDFSSLVKTIGGNRVTVKAIVLGNQDAHFIRPKPSFVSLIGNADILVSTGLDLELWLPTVINKSGNSKIRSGQKGYVSVSQGVKMLEKPKIKSRIEGGVHVYGNPHITCSPLNMKIAAQNIAIGLIKNDPAGKEYYQNNLQNLLDKFNSRLFGTRLVSMLGGETLSKLAEQGKLISFLRKKRYSGRPLIDYLDGWMKIMLPLYGKSIVTYHKNWVYFLKLFGIKNAGTVEPRPGIPPTPQHVTDLVEKMRNNKIDIILAANYFDRQKIMTIAKRVNAKAVIVPLYVGGAEGVRDYFQLMDLWTHNLIKTVSNNGPM